MAWLSITDNPPPPDTMVRVGCYASDYSGGLLWREDVAVPVKTARGWFGRPRIVRQWGWGDWTHWQPLPPPPGSEGGPA